MHLPDFTAEVTLRHASCEIYGGSSISERTLDAQVLPMVGGALARQWGGIGPVGTGGLNAWGCWDSWCCGCSYHYTCNPVCHWDCCDEPCTRCIWPY
jgi:hypothetical protein